MIGTRKIFRRIISLHTGKGRGEVSPLRIEGVEEAPMTPEPDDAERAAEALLEMMVPSSRLPRKEGKKSSPSGDKKGVRYYRQLAGKIAAAHESERRAALRYVAYCEQQLKQLSIVNSQLSILESGLYRHMDTVEREGGDLKRRWQHCLAEVTVRQMVQTQS